MVTNKTELFLDSGKKKQTPIGDFKSMLGDVELLFLIDNKE